MYKLLKNLKWIPVNNDNDCDLIETKSPTHDYIIEQTGDTFKVRYFNRVSGESDKKRNIPSVTEAQNWVQDTHAEEKIRDWLLEEPQSVIARTVEWFQTAYPSPVLQNVVVQQGVHIEEISEMFLEIEGCEQLALVLKELGKQFKASRPSDMKSMASLLQDTDKCDRFVDSMIDQLVTNIGTLTHMGVSAERLLKRVNESNFSKFVDGQALRATPNGKIMKGPDWFEPKLKEHFQVSGKPLLESLEEYNQPEK